MGLLDSLLGAVTGQNSGGQGSTAGIGGTLLSLLASEGGQGGAPGSYPAMNRSPAAVSGGLRELVQRFEQNGFGDVAQSWIGSGQNQQISPDELHQAIGPQTVDRLSQQTGMSHSQLLPLLAQALPLIVDRLTPNNRVPDQHEVARMQQAQPEMAPEMESNRPIDV
jgi:uncharacterized protein YidB (DUF937 family)